MQCTHEFGWLEGGLVQCGRIVWELAACIFCRKSLWTLIPFDLNQIRIDPIRYELNNNAVHLM